MGATKFGQVAGAAILLALAVAAPGQAGAQEKPALACWFYKYQWAYYRMIPNVAPPTPFATGGQGTGLMVTEGLPPSSDETAALIAAIQKSLPRGDAQAPPPQAFMRSVSRIACPPSLNGVDIAVAKIWLKQPEGR